MNIVAFLFIVLFPMDLQGDRFILDHLVIDQYGIDVAIPWDEQTRLALATEWQEPHWYRALVLKSIRLSYKDWHSSSDMDWMLSDTCEFFGDMPFLTSGFDTEWQTYLRGIIHDF